MTENEDILTLIIFNIEVKHEAITDKTVVFWNKNWNRSESSQSEIFRV